MNNSDYKLLYDTGMLDADIAKVEAFAIRQNATVAQVMRRAIRWYQLEVEPVKLPRKSLEGDTDECAVAVC